MKKNQDPIVEEKVIVSENQSHWTLSLLETHTKKGNNEHKYSKQTNKNQNEANPKIRGVVSNPISLHALNGPLSCHLSTPS